MASKSPMRAKLKEMYLMYNEIKAISNEISKGNEEGLVLALTAVSTGAILHGSGVVIMQYFIAFRMPGAGQFSRSVKKGVEQGR